MNRSDQDVVQHGDRDNYDVTAFRQGSETAFTAIYHAYNKRLFFYALRYVETDHQAEDITIEAFTKLWTKRKDFDNKPAIIAYLSTIVRNRCLDILRHEAAKSKGHQRLKAILEKDQNPDLLEEMVRLELLAMIYAETQKLPPRMREVFLLAYRDGLKTAEIAERLNLSTQTVSNQKQSAMQLLKKAFKNKELLLAVLSTLEAQFRQIN
jgi:RNA polymerase sigma-70 factor (family 1)